MCFSAAGPTLWNSLPPDLRQPDIKFQRVNGYRRHFCSGVEIAAHCSYILLCAVRFLTYFHRLRGSESPVLTATHHPYGSPRLSEFFPHSPRGHTPQPIFTQNGSIDVDSRKDVPFAVKSQLFIPPDLQGP